MSYVRKIIDRFGGVRPMARALKKPPSTVASWADRGSIPDAEKPDILQASAVLGLGLVRADFFPLPPDGAA